MARAVQPVLITADVERLVRFYTGLLDAEEAIRFPEDGAVFYVGLRIGTNILGITNDSAPPQGAQRILLSVDVDEVDPLLEQVEGLGGHVASPPKDMPWGQRVAHVQDPDGNTVNLAQELGAGSAPDH